MHNGSTVRFTSKNLDTYNGRKEYLVYHHLPDRTETIGVAFFAGSVWQLGHRRYAKLAELKAVVRHVYTGSALEE